MAILNSNGIVTFSSVPTDAPTTNGPTFGRLVDTNTFYYYDGSDWVTITLGDDTAYDESTWNANLDVPTKNAIRDKFESIATATAAATPLMYKAIISQVGTNDPTATIIYNTLGEVPTFARTMAATYELEVVNPIFTLNKTIILGHPITGVAPISRFIPFSTTVIQFTTHSEDDTGEDLAGTMFVSIEIYP
jgi:hypothetical protein